MRATDGNKLLHMYTVGLHVCMGGADKKNKPIFSMFHNIPYPACRLVLCVRYSVVSDLFMSGFHCIVLLLYLICIQCGRVLNLYFIDLE